VNESKKKTRRRYGAELKQQSLSVVDTEPAPQPDADASPDGRNLVGLDQILSELQRTGRARVQRLLPFEFST